MLKPIIVKNSIVPKLFSWFFPVAAITLFPFIFIRDDDEAGWLIRHETIHFRQYLELFIVGFLLIYVWDFVWGALKYKNIADAYHSIRFEQEAYKNESNPDYLMQRKRLAWRKYSV